MIVYSLRCENGHQFDDWFSSSAAFEDLARAGKLACPECQTAKVEKAVMAPSVSKAGSSSPAGCPVADMTGEMPSCAGSCACFPG